MRLNNLLLLVVTSLIFLQLSACSSTPKARPAALPASPAVTISQINELNERINALTLELQAAQQAAEEAQILAKSAKLTADNAQDVAAKSDDKIERMFQRSVFK